MQRIGVALANWSEKWFPDAYVFAGIAVAVVGLAALAMGRGPMQVSIDFGKSFWNLIPFTMQMAFIQFPLYAGIFGVLMGSGLNEVLARFFVSISTQSTLPLVGGCYSAILGLFLPSGGGKFVVEAPYLLQAATVRHVNLAWMVQVYNAAEALPNFINPFWMLPLLGVTGAKARDLAGFSALQLMFHLPIVLLLLWLLGMTMPYIPPIL